MKRAIKNLFGWRQEMTISFYLLDFIFRRILRNNSGTSWAVHHTSTVHCAGRIKRGKNVYPGDSPGNFIDASNGIEIGDYTNLGPNVGLISKNHDPVNNDEFSNDPPLKLGRHCWIGMNAVILPGVELGNFTIVGANAVVNKSFTEGYCIIAGNPASIVKNLDKEACEKFAASK